MNITRKSESDVGATLQVNKEGFTVLNNDGVIVLDVPLARAAVDMEIAVVMLKVIHGFLYVKEEN